MYRIMIVSTVSAGLICLLGEALPVEGSLWGLGLRGLAELGAFGLVAWTWWYALRHGLPRLMDAHRSETEQLRQYFGAQLDKLLEDLRAERQQRAADSQRLADALTGLVAHCAARVGTNEEIEEG